ncbi:helix-turn-helix transcriptional regulator [Sporomusa sp.]|jgi:transcriptional regulator with XRE-family HTH domain|uniref:helix-turn-helix domain-containing protein n=1 Tax=Sporomusa sp. TaxID=2078658 RepID=UPI002C64C70B|nr:helix-turn-helix transcriptional regulator [Sporomusa sp.]MDF2873767.1 helix-turn-helix protein [Sporomusa sp.]HWR05971.1 helix-turn-helix transcriptional regulator [Sporomusa sp.]
MKTLGTRIKQLRTHLTQEELAAILKVDRSTLASWEVDRREPDIATLSRIASYFQVSIDWLVGHKLDKAASSSKSVLLHEAIGNYQITIDKSWEKVIATAEAYGIEPEAVQQLLEINADIALALKHGKPKK